MALRILFADDQIPDDAIADDEVLDHAAARYPRAQRGFVLAFAIMRRMVTSLREHGYDVTVARRLDDALELVDRERFDVAIVDLGWYGDDAVDRSRAPVAGWDVADAIAAANRRRGDDRPTAQIMYSARFAKRPDISLQAATKGLLPYFKPYQELDTIPLESDEALAGSEDRIQAGCHSLQAAVAFAEHLLTSRSERDRDAEMIRRTLQTRLDRAIEREQSWDRLARLLLPVAILLVAAGIGVGFWLGVGEGALTAGLGALTGLFQAFVSRQLRSVTGDIQSAAQDLARALDANRPSTAVTE